MGSLGFILEVHWGWASEGFSAEERCIVFPFWEPQSEEVNRAGDHPSEGGERLTHGMAVRVERTDLRAAEEGRGELTTR